MILNVIIWTASILKVVDPTDVLYVFHDPSCLLESGIVEVVVIDPNPEDAADPIGYLTQDGSRCDVYELVVAGP